MSSEYWLAGVGKVRAVSSGQNTSAVETALKCFIGLQAASMAGCMAGWPAGCTSAPSVFSFHDFHDSFQKRILRLARPLQDTSLWSQCLQFLNDMVNLPVWLFHHTVRLDNFAAACTCTCLQHSKPLSACLHSGLKTALA